MAAIKESIIAAPAFRSACFAFLLTRAIVFGTLILAANVQHLGKGPAFGQPVEEAKIDLNQPNPFRRIGAAATAADALWYLDIAEKGYERASFNLDKQHNWAFFPLYPLIVRAAARLTGEFQLTAILLSNIFFFASLIILHKTAAEFGTDNPSADRVVFYLAAFPTSFFFSFPFTESLFLLLTVATLFCARRQRWWLAGILGAFASATRLAGLFLLLPLAILYWQQFRARPRLQLLALLLTPLGLAGYMIYLRSITGNALAFYDIQAVWGHRFTFFLQPLWDYLRSPLLLGIHWDFRVLNFVVVLMAFVCIVVLLKRRQWALALYSLVSLIIPLSANLSLQSLTRYAGVIFPIFFVLGEAGRRRRVDQIISAIFLALLALLTAMYVLRIAVGMG